MKHLIHLRRTAYLSAMVLTAYHTVFAQPACFQSIAAAVQGTGAEDGSGFRVEGTLRNLVDGAGWVRVSSCAHPERPARLVRTAFKVAPRPSTEATIQASPVIVRAGSAVTVVSLGESVHLEVAGTAIEGGVLGQRIRVRVAAEGDERFLAGIVRTADTLEMVR